MSIKHLLSKQGRRYIAKAASILAMSRQKAQELYGVANRRKFFLLFDDAAQIKMSTYIKCACKGDKSGLIMLGEPTDEDLDNAWLSIMSQCQEISSDAAQLKYLELVGEINAVVMHMNLVKNCCYGIEVGYACEEVTQEEIQPLIELLHNAGYKYKFTKKGHVNEVKAVYKQEKRYQMLHTKLLAEKKERYGERGEKGINSEKYYYDLINTLRKHEDWRTIDPIKIADEITAYAFFTSLDSYNKHMERLQNQTLLNESVHGQPQ